MEAEERNNHVCVNYGFNAIRIVFILQEFYHFYGGLLFCCRAPLNAWRALDDFIILHTFPFLWWSFVLLQSSKY